jgi:hypothetical protein
VALRIASSCFDIVRSLKSPPPSDISTFVRDNYYRPIGICKMRIIRYIIEYSRDVGPA